jgi:hypothetical protein
MLDEKFFSFLRALSSIGTPKAGMQWNISGRSSAESFLNVYVIFLQRDSVIKIES